MAQGLVSEHPLGETSHSVGGRGGPSASCSPRGRGPSPWSPWALLRKGGSLRGAPPRGQAAHGALGPPVAPGPAGWSGEGTRVAAPSPPPDTVLPRPTLRLPAPPAPPRFPRPSRAGLRTPGRIGLARPGDPGRGAAGAEAAPGLRISAPVVRPGGACPRPAPEGWRRHVPRGSRPSPGAAAGGGAAGGSLSAPLRPPRPRVPMSRVPRVPVSPRPRIPAGASRDRPRWPRGRASPAQRLPDPGPRAGRRPRSPLRCRSCPSSPGRLRAGPSPEPGPYLCPGLCRSRTLSVPTALEAFTERFHADRTRGDLKGGCL